jgi:hypothetical protein
VTQDASFVLGFGGKLPAGHSTLLAQIIVNANAMTAEIQRMPIKIASKGDRYRRDARFGERRRDSFAQGDRMWGDAADDCSMR